MISDASRSSVFNCGVIVGGRSSRRRRLIPSFIHPSPHLQSILSTLSCPRLGVKKKRATDDDEETTDFRHVRDIIIGRKRWPLAIPDDGGTGSNSGENFTAFFWLMSPAIQNFRKTIVKHWPHLSIFSRIERKKQANDSNFVDNSPHLPIVSANRNQKHAPKIPSLAGLCENLD